MVINQSPYSNKNLTIIFYSKTLSLEFYSEIIGDRVSFCHIYREKHNFEVLEKKMT